MSPLAVPRPVVLLWCGQLLSALGTRLHQIALMWIAVEAIGERAGFVALGGAGAQFVFGLLGGVYADRWDRRKTMIAADLLRAAAVGTLAVAALYAPVSLFHLASVAVVVGALDALFGPALQASLPVLVSETETLQRSNALLNLNHRIARVAGPALTGALIALVPIAQFFAIDAATFLASALAIAALGRGYAWKAPASGLRSSIVSEVRGALHLVAGNRNLFWGIALIGAWNLVSGTTMAVGFPLLARDVFEGGADTYGYLVAAYGVGNVASSVVLATRTVRRRSLAVCMGAGIFALGMLGLAAAPTFPLALFACALAAIGGPLTDVTLLVIIQTEMPPDQIGKVFSLRMTVSKAFNGLGLVAASALLAVFGVRLGIAVGAAALGLFSLFAYSRMQVRFR